MPVEIVFLVNAIGHTYEQFVVPFIYFALSSHPNGAVEVVVVSKAAFERHYAQELEALRALECSNFIVRNMAREVCKHHIPNVYRFFEVPTIFGKYTYIVDVDVMFLEDCVPHFEAHWPDECVVNNMIRKSPTGENLERLTGMHMVKTSEYYTASLAKCQEQLYRASHRKNNDEHLLYKMVETCHRLPPLENSWRPIFGIHFSPNRGPDKQMSLRTSDLYCDAYFEHAAKHPELFALPVFQQLSDQLRERFEFKRTIPTLS